MQAAIAAQLLLSSILGANHQCFPAAEPKRPVQGFPRLNALS